MRILSLSALVLLLILSLGSTALACDCITLSPSKSFEQADVVFEGEVIRIAETKEGTAYTFEVSKLLKGEPVREVTIIGRGTNCDQHFSPDTVYRVYARRYEGNLTTGICSGNKVLRSKKRNNSYGGSQSASVWRVWHIKPIVVAGIVVVTIVILCALTRQLRHQRG